MTKPTKTTDTTKALEATETETSKARKPRKKVYERAQETDLPADLVKLFEKQDYELRLKRWSLFGDEDYRYMKQCEDEGYEFVSVSELPEWYLTGVRIMDTKGRKGLVIIGDLCLMKIDADLNRSRNEYYQKKSAAQIDAVSVYNLTKKGFKDLGTKSQKMMKEPTFQE